MNWDFPIGLGHFGASRSYMIKGMSFKRMIRSSYREPSDTLFILFKDQTFVYDFPREFFVDEETTKGLLTFHMNTPISLEYARKAL
ncbi:Protein Ycf2 [Bienertia sinuspersici]